jgi:hypothetical protein
MIDFFCYIASLDDADGIADELALAQCLQQKLLPNSALIAFQSYEVSVGEGCIVAC